eukprot:gnl/TRDRNA2_/TRDRNA2_3905_c0_seq1.p1 gnl/TRDRNA2_/TRDRNA2_3905_c0~~gnl/TRDRNA2_/TRDRNA2_3905_c0_seq1.p1  ORF type:complete len:109 (+),score=9.90 gnl/TRDRNA2_/TRDRNA2_3905_c0_seq1:1-327(+)
MDDMIANIERLSVDLAASVQKVSVSNVQHEQSGAQLYAPTTGKQDTDLYEAINEMTPFSGTMLPADTTITPQLLGAVKESERQVQKIVGNLFTQLLRHLEQYPKTSNV